MSAHRLLQAALPLPLLAVLLTAAGAAAQTPTPTAAAAPGASSIEAAPPAAPAANTVRPGSSVSGTLDDTDQAISDGTLYDDWSYNGTRGERLTITLRSEAFDAYVRFGRMKGGEFTQTGSQDDGAGGTDSLLRVTLPADGEYVIRVNTLFEGTGAYTLQVRSTKK